jgi:hypothetical protein
MSAPALSLQDIIQQSERTIKQTEEIMNRIRLQRERSQREGKIFIDMVV